MQDVAAERGVLAGIVRYGAECYDDVCDMVGTETFSDNANQTFWVCVDYLVKQDPNLKAVDFPSLISASKQLGVDHLMDKGQIEYLRALHNTPIQRESVSRLAAQIRKLEIARKLDYQLELARQNLRGVRGDESIDKIIAMAEGPIFDFTSLLNNNQFGGVRRMGDGAREYLQHLMDNPREMMGISTGMKRFDKSIGGGLRGGSFDIVGARQKTGKTQLADNVGLHIAKQNIHVLNVDTEMNWEEHIIRVAANLAGVDVYNIETGRVRLRPEDRNRVLEAADQLKELPYDYLCVRGMPCEEILAGMRRWVTRTVGLGADGKAKSCAIMYDWLKLMSAQDISKNMAEFQMLGFVSSSLKNFMGRYGVSCLCFSQLNREGIDQEETNVMRGSDRIIDVCTSFSIYKWKSEEELAEGGQKGRKYTHKLVPIICRHGEGLEDEDYINVQAEYKIGRITEGPLRSELESSLDNAQTGILVHETAPIQFAV